MRLQPEVLEARASWHIDSLREAQDNGLPLARIKRLEAIKPRLHRDLLMVQLGLKPYAGYFENVVFESYDDRYGRNHFAPAEGVVISPETRTAWNIPLVEAVMASNQELVEALVAKAPDLKDKLKTPADDPRFDLLVIDLSMQRPLSEAMALEGQLYGVPREAATFFSHSLSDIGRLLDQLSRDSRGWHTNFSLADIFSHTGDLRERVVELAQTLNVDPSLINALNQARISDTPGTGFFTWGELTTPEENALTAAYKTSRMDSKLETFLSEEANS